MSMLKGSRGAGRVELEGVDGSAAIVETVAVSSYELVAKEAPFGNTCVLELKLAIHTWVRPLEIGTMQCGRASCFARNISMLGVRT